MLIVNINGASLTTTLRGPLEKVHLFISTFPIIIVKSFQRQFLISSSDVLNIKDVSLAFALADCCLSYALFLSKQL